MYSAETQAGPIVRGIGELERIVVCVDVYMGANLSDALNGCSETVKGEKHW